MTLSRADSSLLASHSVLGLTQCDTCKAAAANVPEAEAKLRIAHVTFQGLGPETDPANPASSKKPSKGTRAWRY
jgi:hypothetical protein